VQLQVEGTLKRISNFPIFLCLSGFRLLRRNSYDDLSC